MSATDTAEKIRNAVAGNTSGIAPGTYPGDDGGVVLEWGSPDRVVTLEISPDEGFFLFHLDVASRQASEFTPIDMDEAIQRVGQALAA